MNSRVMRHSRAEEFELPVQPRRAPGRRTLGAPKMCRAACCRIRPTPNVTSRVSSGRRYIHWMQRDLQQEAEQPADDEARPAARRAATTPASEMTCWTTKAVKAPAMMNSPWAMLITPIWPKVSERPERGEQQQRTEPMPCSSG